MEKGWGQDKKEDKREQNNIFNKWKQKIIIIKIDSKQNSHTMIKKEHNHDFDKNNKTKHLPSCKYVDQQTGSDTPKKSSFKARFIQWLKQLPLDERYLALKVHAPGLSKQLQQSLIQLQNQASEPASKDSSASKKISYRQAKTIIESIVLISDGEDFLDNIGFDFNYIEHPDKLYELLATTLSQQQKLMFQTEQYQIDILQLKQVLALVQKCRSKQQLILAVISFIRGEIFLKFEEKRSINLEQERNRKKQFSMFWRNLSEENKRKLLLLNKEDYNALSSYLAERKILLSAADLERECTDLTQMEKNEFCNKIFKCKLKKSLTYFTDYHELVYKLWKAELTRKKKKNRNNKNNNPQKLSISLHRVPIIQINEKPNKRSNYNLQKQQQKAQIKLQTQKGKYNSSPTTKAKNQKSSHNPNSNSFNHSNNIQTDRGVKSANQFNAINQKSNKGLTSGQGINSLNVIQNGQNQYNPGKRKRNRNRHKKSVSAESKQTNSTNHRFEKEQKQQYEKKIQEETSTSSQHFIEGVQSSCLMMLSTLPCNINLKLQESIQSIKQVPIYPKVDFESQVFAKVKIDIQGYSELINQEANEFYERRVIAYERIQFMLGIWKIPIKLFGSCASGITIKNSDIDIAVDNSILNYFLHLSQTSRLRGALEQLEKLLQQQPWVTGLKLIKTAAIPLIKLKVNTSINFIQMPGLQLYQPYIDSLNRQHLSAGQIHIDLTIQTINKQLQCNHLGIISTDQINNWLKSIKSLHPIVIIVKNYLTKTNLNITYEGGLNTYSMICMLVAFIKEKKLEEQTDVVQVFYRIVKFYSFEFDEKTTGIDLLSPQDIFYNKLTLKTTKSDTCPNDCKLPELNLIKSTTAFCQADLQIKDPLNNGKNMTKNCYSFPKIRQIFQTIYKACFEEQQQKLEGVFRQQFQRRCEKGQFIKAQMLKPLSKEVRGLLEECKLKMGNPFLTLFE